MDWVASARELAALIADITQVAPREQWLTDRLLEFKFEPSDPAAATIELVASSHDAIFSAGRATRFELDGPKAAQEKVAALSRAVAAGRLVETIRRHRVRYRIDLGDGSKMSGSSSLSVDRREEKPGTYRYGPYPEVGDTDG